MKRYLWLLPVFALGGCIIPSSSRFPEEYDLKPVSVRFSAPVKFGAFSNLSGADRRFLTRSGDKMTRDEQSRFTSTPDVLLLRALSAAQLREPSEKNAARCSLTLYRFGWNGSDATIAADVLLQKDKERLFWHFENAQKCASDSAEDRIDALDRCTEALAASIAERLKTFEAK